VWQSVGVWGEWGVRSGSVGERVVARGIECGCKVGVQGGGGGFFQKKKLLS
jgi:hypothetical protein